MIDISQITPHKNGKIPIAICAVLTLITALFIGKFISFVLALITLWCVWFFRDPERIVPIADGLIISPADGKISEIEIITPPDEVDIDADEMLRISIFMNIFDVHVNRAPISAIIENISYIQGKFINATLDKSHKLNERQAFTLKTKNGTKIAIVQIAGLIARRIDRFVKQGDYVETGTRIGMIRFGSRVDIYMPKNTIPLVEIGQKTIAGETRIADLKNQNAKAQFIPK